MRHFLLTFITIHAVRVVKTLRLYRSLSALKYLPNRPALQMHLPYFYY